MSTADRTLNDSANGLPGRCAPAWPANLLRLAAGLAAGAMLWSAFPPLDRSDSAWFALVPLILMARHTPPRAAFFWGWLTGVAFWLPALTWLWRLIDNGGPLPLVVLGYAALAVYCALYFGLYGLAASALWRGVSGRAWRGWRLLAVVVAEPLLWAGSEYLRGTLFSGFPWNTLAVSQVANTALMQPAAWGGMALVSALLFGVSAGAASLIERTLQPLFDRREARPGFDLWRSAEGILPLLILAGCWLGGLERVRTQTRSRMAHETWRVALVQPATPSIFEITDEIILKQRQVLLDLTTYAATTSPDLVVWPETAVQGVMPWHAEVMALASNAARAAGAPLLTGTIETEQIDRGRRAPRVRYYNAAWLFDAQGAPIGRYRKQRLVPFGEFVPGARWLPALERLSPIGFSCSPGRESTIMRIRGRNERTAGRTLSFSPIICFEDLFACLNRRAVRRGARLLVNITNNAWFDGSTQNEQHLRQAVLRTIENGVPMVRAANTGVTGVIDASGRIARFMPGAAWSSAGFMPVCVRIPPTDMPRTIYNRFGDWLFGIPAAIFTLLWALAGYRRKRGV